MTDSDAFLRAQLDAALAGEAIRRDGLARLAAIEAATRPTMLSTLLWAGQQADDLAKATRRALEASRALDRRAATEAAPALYPVPRRASCRCHAPERTTHTSESHEDHD